MAKWSNEWIRKHLHIQRWKHPSAPRFAHQFRCPNLTSLGDFLSRTQNQPCVSQTWAKSLPLHINQQCTSILHVTARRKSDLYTTRPEVKFIIPSSQTNIQRPKLSHPLTPSQFSFPLRFSRIFSEGVSDFESFEFFEVPKSSDVDQNIGRCSGLTDLCTEKLVLGEPSGCRDGYQGILPNASTLGTV